MHYILVVTLDELSHTKKHPLLFFMISFLILSRPHSLKTFRHRHLFIYLFGRFSTSVFRSSHPNVPVFSFYVFRNNTWAQARLWSYCCCCCCFLVTLLSVFNIQTIQVCVETFWVKAIFIRMTVERNSQSGSHGHLFVSLSHTQTHLKISVSSIPTILSWHSSM